MAKKESTAIASFLGLFAMIAFSFYVICVAIVHSKPKKEISAPGYTVFEDVDSVEMIKKED